MVRMTTRKYLDLGCNMLNQDIYSWENREKRYLSTFTLIVVHGERTLRSISRQLLYGAIHVTAVQGSGGLVERGASGKECIWHILNLQYFLRTLYNVHCTVTIVRACYSPTGTVTVL